MLTGGASGSGNGTVTFSVASNGAATARTGMIVVAGGGFSRTCTVLQAGMANCGKHFPGHGSAATDTHKGLTDITDTWQASAELMPYETLISDGIVDMVMVGHLVNTKIDPEYPASLSKATITGMLRNKLGFNGVVISDDLEMGAITAHYNMDEVVLLAIDAGMDILLYGNNISYDPDIAAKVHSTILKLVKAGKISRERLEESYMRIRALKKQLNH